MPGSDAGDEFNDDLEVLSFLSLCLRYYGLLTYDCLDAQQDFIVDIDGIQAHGTSRALLLVPLVSSSDQSVDNGIGISAADITKLKANGFYTVAVWIPLPG